MNFTIWNVINFTFLTLGAFIPLLSAVLILNRGKWRFLPNRLLSLYLLGMGVACMMTFLIQTRLILHVPWLYRLPSPLYYLMFPAGFLYVKTLLRDRNKLSPYEYLHALPAFLHFIELLPYHFKPMDYKIRHLTESLNNPVGAFIHDEGWLPSYQHNIIRGFMGLIYGLLIIYILIKFSQKHPSLTKLYPGLTQWLWFFGLMMSAFGLVLIYGLFLARWENISSQALFITISFSTTQIISGIVLFLHPAFLYGMPRLKYNIMANVQRSASAIESFMKQAGDIEVTRIENDGLHNSLEHLPNEYPVLMETYLIYKNKLEGFMLEKQPYLQAHYKVSDLARELDIPQHHITILLNRILNTRFNDYINNYRINHIKQLIEKHGLTHTLEGFANMSGFSNRTTFIRAVQRVTGKSPSQYFVVKNNIP